MTRASSQRQLKAQARRPQGLTYHAHAQLKRRNPFSEDTGRDEFKQTGEGRGRGTPSGSLCEQFQNGNPVANNIYGREPQCPRNCRNDRRRFGVEKKPEHGHERLWRHPVLESEEASLLYGSRLLTGKMPNSTHMSAAPRQPTPTDSMRHESVSKKPTDQEKHVDRRCS